MPVVSHRGRKLPATRNGRGPAVLSSLLLCLVLVGPFHAAFWYENYDEGEKALREESWDDAVRYLELARIAWLEEHDQPYAKYIEMGRHFATTRVEVDYRRAVRFDETVEVVVWLDWVRNASLRLCYALRCEGELVATAATEHASVDLEGRARRIPRERRDAFQGVAAREAPAGLVQQLRGVASRHAGAG